MNEQARRETNAQSALEAKENPRKGVLLRLERAWKETEVKRYLREHGGGGVVIQKDEVAELFNLLETQWGLRRLRIALGGYINYLRMTGELQGEFETYDKRMSQMPEPTRLPHRK